ncbi:tRNA1(Val) (adenine(37)-N6)-methyltransferase [Halalkalibacterium halodurans]|jgi:tRNA1(Val) A37 N6-methylase TrmN6|uniref:Methyltransferase domain-containing protein n=1 Tax=Halalkalibacterium halodurans TaxID=86665 RepID=A0A0M0KCM7_ALKHA|nr:tRNA1(Val) (adenine(37)-N6)-methyltransferase [Halalkalibacterium halodurans]TPE68540.1 tRNA1(Val) (adenine(37)-N6)-methyltransferase [Halalkalibacterium halodurans]
MIPTYDDERIDYTPGRTRQVIQSPNVFAFSMDAVLLARFVYLPIQKGDILDLCTGNGIIPLLLTERSKARMVGVEIQERLFEMAIRNSQLNDLEQQLTFMNLDLKDLPKNMPMHSFDVVTCNPPYFANLNEDLLNDNPYLAIARHEIHCSLDDVLRVSSQMVKNRGKVAIVHRPERLTELIEGMKRYRIEPKRLQFIHPKAGAEANIVLIEGMLGGNSGVKVLPPLTVYDGNGKYTIEFQQVFAGQ